MLDNDFMPAATAMRYLGIDDLDELERIIVEHGVEVELDGNGMVYGVEAESLKHALFEEHRHALGYRPDDPAVGQANRMRLENERAARKAARKLHHERLTRRVAARRALKEQS
jgi:hypothetical protein